MNLKMALAAAWLAVPTISGAQSQYLTVAPEQTMVTFFAQTGPLNPLADMLFVTFFSVGGAPDGVGFDSGAPFTASLYDGSTLLGTAVSMADSRYFVYFAYRSAASLNEGAVTIDFSRVLHPASELTLRISSTAAYDIRMVRPEGNFIPDLLRAVSASTAEPTNSPNYLEVTGTSVVGSVPEPAAWALLVLGLGAGALRRAGARGCAGGSTRRPRCRGADGSGLHLLPSAKPRQPSNRG